MIFLILWAFGTLVVWSTTWFGGYPLSPWQIFWLGLGWGIVARIVMELIARYFTKEGR